MTKDKQLFFVYLLCIFPFLNVFIFIPFYIPPFIFLFFYKSVFIFHGAAMTLEIQELLLLHV